MVLVWADLWFLVTCGFCVWSARPIHLMWFLWIGGLALDADGCPHVLRVLLLFVDC